MSLSFSLCLCTSCWRWRPLPRVAAAKKKRARATAARQRPVTAMLPREWDFPSPSPPRSRPRPLQRSRGPRWLWEATWLLQTPLGASSSPGSQVRERERAKHRFFFFFAGTMDWTDDDASTVEKKKLTPSPSFLSLSLLASSQRKHRRQDRLRGPVGVVQGGSSRQEEGAPGDPRPREHLQGRRSWSRGGEASSGCSNRGSAPAPSAALPPGADGCRRLQAQRGAVRERGPRGGAAAGGQLRAADDEEEGGEDRSSSRRRGKSCSRSRSNSTRRRF